MRLSWPAVLLLVALGCSYNEPGVNITTPPENADPYVLTQDEVDTEVRSLPFKHELWRFSLYQRIRNITLGGHYLYIETEDHEVIAMDRFTGVTQWRWKIPTTEPLDFPPVETLDEIDGKLVPASVKFEKAVIEIDQLQRKIDQEIRRVHPPRVEELKAAQAEWDKKVAEFEKVKQEKGSEHEEAMKIRGELDEMARKIDALKVVQGPDMTEIDRLRKLRTMAEGKKRDAVENDNVYCVSKTNIYCISRLPQPRYTHQMLWSRKLQFIPSATPFATRSYVYVASVDHDRVYALAVNREGFEQGFFEANPLFKPQDDLVPPIMKMANDIVTQPVYMGQQLYFLSRGGFAYRYNDKRETRPPWPYYVNSDLQAGPAMHHRILNITQTDGKVLQQPVKFLFVGAINGAFLALDADAGGLHWKYETGAMIKETPVAKDDTVYVKTDNGYLYALNIWPMVKDVKGRIYWEDRVGAGGAKERIWAPKRNGDVRWKIPLGERFMVKGASGKVYVMGPKRVMYCMDEMTGNEKGRYPIEHLSFLITNTHDEIFYCATRQGHLYALKESKAEY